MPKPKQCTIAVDEELHGLIQRLAIHHNMQNRVQISLKTLVRMAVFAKAKGSPEWVRRMTATCGYDCAFDDSHAEGRCGASDA